MVGSLPSVAVSPSCEFNAIGIKGQMEEEASKNARMTQLIVCASDQQQLRLSIKAIKVLHTRLSFSATQ